MSFSGDATDGRDIYKNREDHERARKRAKTMRLLFEMDLHTTMTVNNSIHVLRVVGGWVYFHRSGDGSAAAFVPDRRDVI